MNREGHLRIYALIKHLLAGHDGHACPAGDRPIVNPRKPEPPPRCHKWMSLP